MAKQTSEERNREKQQLWKSHIDSWKSSGLKQVEYCRKNDLSRFQFTYWKRKHNKKVDPVTFVPVLDKSDHSQIFFNNKIPIKLITGSYQIEIGDGF